ncbi:MAG: hypothetical protein C0446_06515 [Chitinophaga sp.]|jgi:hypothetical protein|nr:hypothetical protein [Chitinophaga sp.]
MLMQIKSVKKAPLVMLLVSLHLAIAAFAFTGIVDDKAKSSKFTLKSLNSFSKKGLSLSAIKSNLQYKGITLTGNGLLMQNSDVNTMLQYNNGNTTYVYPYKIKVKVPKFKIPQEQHK